MTAIPTFSELPSSSMPSSQIFARLLVGAEAQCWLADQNAREAWHALYESCPWRTVFQSPAFVTTWYEIYQSRYQPVLIVGTDEAGIVVGLMAAAKSLKYGSITVAGDNQAEYQGWLAHEPMCSAFGQQALELLAPLQARNPLTFTYLPPRMPIAEIEELSDVKARCELRTWRRPLVSLDDPVVFNAYLKRHWGTKNIRNNLNRLRREHELRFLHLQTREELHGLFPTLIAYHDVRHRAAHNNAPFLDDPLKEAFFVAMHETSGHLHVTALYQDDKLVSAHLGFSSTNILHLGATVYSPWHAKNSPFAFHLLMLAELLAAQGYHSLDLTAGEDAWKDRFATSHDEVCSLTVYPSAACKRGAGRYARLHSGAKHALKRCLGQAGLDFLRSQVRGLRACRTPTAVRCGATRLLQNLWSNREIRLLCSTGLQMARGEFRFARDNLGDFLRLAMDCAPEGRQAFYSDLLRVVERGAAVYTLVRDNRLLAFGWWYTTKGDLRRVEMSHLGLPNESVVIDCIWAAPIEEGRILVRSCLVQMLEDAASTTKQPNVYLPVPDRNQMLYDIAVECGFRDRPSLFKCTKLFKTVYRRRQPPQARVVKRLKCLCLHLSRGVGLFRIARRLTRNKLRILCYHGFSVSDEAAFRPGLFIRPSTFTKRLTALRRMKIRVVGLADGLAAMDADELKQPTAVITIDDGFAPTYSALKQWSSEPDFAVTVYVPSYYAEKQSPIFRLVVHYMFWASKRRVADLHKLGMGFAGPVHLHDRRAVGEASERIVNVGENTLDNAGRERVCRWLGDALAVDYDELIASRRLSLMNADELSELENLGTDIQLHTHRHRLPLDAGEAAREISENRCWLQKAVRSPLVHLCYPSGEWSREHFPVLRSQNIASAVTCDVGLNTAATERLALKRFLDGEDVAQIEFEAEMSGFLELVRRLLRFLRIR